MFIATPKDKALFIYNPNSGKRIIEQNISYIEKVLKSKFKTVDIVKSKSAEHYKEVIKNACYNYDYVFFSGGDGTFNMTVNSIPDDYNKLPVFGYLPGGTTCDMAYNTNISKDPKEGIVDLMNSNIKNYAIGKIGDKKFCYVCSSGKITSIAHDTPVELKKKYGKLGYIFFGLKNFKKFIKPCKYIIDGVMYKSIFVTISNAKHLASFLLTDNEQGHETYYCVVVKRGLFKGVFNFAYTVLNGIEKAYKKHKIDLFYSKEFMVDSELSNWDTDGENSSIKLPTTIGYSGLTIKLLINRD